ncbi:MAG: amino acid aminotransferase [Pseudomonadales bacterium]
MADKKVLNHMFSQLQQPPADPILGLSVKFKADSKPNKIDLGPGIYKDEAGHTPVLACVKTAEQFRVENEKSKIYLGSAGSALFNEKMTALILGDHKVINENRIRTISTPGGTGALRIAGEFINRCKPGATIWVSNPTWANHQGVFTAAGLNVKTYPYYDYENNCLDFAGMVEALRQIPKDDAVLLHACCHNPSGMDLNKEQWQQVSQLAKEVGFTPVVDMAYQGFGQGLDVDAYGLRLMADTVEQMIICSSCSKNFGLYRDRIGACSIIGKSASAADIIASVLLTVVRVNYSMPPAHGAAIVETILSSQELTAQWHEELKVMRDRIAGMRQLFVDQLAANGANRDFNFIKTQNGMFSFLGIDTDQIQRLQDEFGIYVVGSSRINLAGISPDNVDYLSRSIATVLK